MTRIKRILDAVWEAFRYLFLTPSWGSKRRRAQEEDERRLEEEHINGNVEKVCCSKVKMQYEAVV